MGNWDDEEESSARGSVEVWDLPVDGGGSGGLVPPALLGGDTVEGEGAGGGLLLPLADDVEDLGDVVEVSKIHKINNKEENKWNMLIKAKVSVIKRTTLKVVSL